MTEIIDPSPEQVLSCPMPPNDVDAATIHEYLIALLATLWDEQEGFSGKRPFGNSDWVAKLAKALMAAGYVEGTLKDGYYLMDYDRGRAHRLVAEAIQSLAPKPPQGRPRGAVSPGDPDWVDGFGPVPGSGLE